ncbi:MAG TPA: CRISPR-associated endonuclease Cas2 [Candidatus Micrarchaeia archaeon]|nr:CRISPR-associated endonuclease Cas2 [Candidatus Micrarchaeia archaeon]
MDVLVAYDIDTTTVDGVRRLTRVAHICERYGVRVQDSVFECRLLPARYQRLVEELRTRIDRRLDSVLFYRVGESLGAVRTSLGRNASHRPGDPWIL